MQALKNSTYLFACKRVADLATANHRRNLSVIGWGASWRMWRDETSADGAVILRFHLRSFVRIPYIEERGMRRNDRTALV